MGDTVKQFVETLRADGVEVGRKEAEGIRQQAETDAARIIQEAEAEAEQIVAEAERERDRTVERTQTNLRFAARDTVSQLRDTLRRVIRRVLDQATNESLSDPEFLKELIREVVIRYASADAESNQTVDLNVSPEMQRKLSDWVIARLHAETDRGRLPLNLHGALNSAGFEYTVADGTVEVTTESVVHALSRVVAPELRELIASAVATN